MCQYSLEGYPNRKAKQGEELVLRGFGANGGHAGLFGHHGNSTRLVCVPIGQSLTLDKVAFTDEPQLRAAYPRHFERALPWLGKTDVVVRMASWNAATYDSLDCLEFADGARLHLAFFRLGTKAYVGLKPRDLDRVLGLDQIRAEVPKDQPTLITDDTPQPARELIERWWRDAFRL